MKYKLSFFLVVITSIISCFTSSTYGNRRPWWDNGVHAQGGHYPYGGHYPSGWHPTTQVNLPQVKPILLNPTRATSFFNYFLRKGPQPRLYYRGYYWGSYGWEQERRL